MTDNRCVCCGEIIPEGRMVCLRCENGSRLNISIIMKEEFLKMLED